MKQKFSRKWKASSQRRKQRKYRVNAPLHVKRKFLSATLSKELRKKYGRNIELRKGDEVKIMRGKFKGKQGKISDVDLKNSKVGIEGIQRVKKDGSKVNVFVHASNLKIINLDLEDRKRFKRKKLGEKTEKKLKSEGKEKKENKKQEKNV